MARVKKDAEQEAQRAQLMRKTKKDLVDDTLTLQRDLATGRKLIADLQDEHRKAGESWDRQRERFEAELAKRDPATEYQRGYEEQARENAKVFGTSGAVEITSVFAVPPYTAQDFVTGGLRIDAGGYRFRPSSSQTSYKAGDQVRVVLIHDSANGTVTLRVGPARPQSTKQRVEMWETLYKKAPEDLSAQFGVEGRDWERDDAQKIRHLEARNAHLDQELTRLRDQIRSQDERHNTERQRLRDDRQRIADEFEAAVKVIGAVHRLYGEG